MYCLVMIDQWADGETPIHWDGDKPFSSPFKESIWFFHEINFMQRILSGTPGWECGLSQFGNFRNKVTASSSFLAVSNDQNVFKRKIHLYNIFSYLTTKNFQGRDQTTQMRKFEEDFTRFFFWECNLQQFVIDLHLIGNKPSSTLCFVLFF